VRVEGALATERPATCRPMRRSGQRATDRSVSPFSIRSGTAGDRPRWRARPVGMPRIPPAHPIDRAIGVARRSALRTSGAGTRSASGGGTALRAIRAWGGIPSESRSPLQQDLERVTPPAKSRQGMWTEVSQGAIRAVRALSSMPTSLRCCGTRMPVVGGEPAWLRYPETLRPGPQPWRGTPALLRAAAALPWHKLGPCLD